jgi:hypothetical protein
MFSASDLWQQNLIDEALKKAGYTTYNPHKDGIEVASVMRQVNKGLALPPAQVLEVVTFVHKVVFALDVYQLVERCQSVILTLDGRVPDDGSVSEAAMAFTADKPIVVFKTTPIAMLAGWDNPLVQGLSTQWSYVDAVPKVPAALAKAVVAQGQLKGPPAQAGPHLNAAAALGQEIWNTIGSLHRVAKASPAGIYSAVTKLEAQLKPLLDEVFL